VNTVALAEDLESVSHLFNLRVAAAKLKTMTKDTIESDDVWVLCGFMDRFTKFLDFDLE
jgi:hypothetical protein